MSGDGSGAAAPVPDRRFTAWPGLIEAYRDRLPVSDATPVITLREGGTPLLPAPYLSERVEARVLLKYEGLNPTGSFKDRGMTLAISKAVEEGSKAVICASTGNTSASAAAYAARAGLVCAVLIPEGHIALGKLAQALIHGAKVIQIKGNFDQALTVVRELAARDAITLVNSVNPYRLEGQKTAAFEIVDESGDAPHVHCIPVGNAGNITAYWRGYGEYHAAGRAATRPRMLGWQAAGSAPLVSGEPVAFPETIATAIRIGNPASWDGAIAARDESGGAIGAVTDVEILDAYRLLAEREGVFCEPASAASVAGLLRAVDGGLIRDGETVVCTLTGHGLKDPERAISTVDLGISVEPTAAAVAVQLGRARDRGPPAPKPKKNRGNAHASPIRCARRSRASPSIVSSSASRATVPGASSSFWLSRGPSGDSSAASKAAAAGSSSRVRTADGAAEAQFDLESQHLAQQPLHRRAPLRRLRRGPASPASSSRASTIAWGYGSSGSHSVTRSDRSRWRPRATAVRQLRRSGRCGPRSPPRTARRRRRAPGPVR